jgi:DNA repair protein RecO (recombination protein O)
MERDRLYRTKGIVLRRRDFDEADRLLTVLTCDRGKVTLLAKGARKIASRKAPHVDLFRQVDLLVHQGRNFGIVSQAEATGAYCNLGEDLQRVAAAHYVAELVDSLLIEGDDTAGVYELTASVLEWLSDGGDPRLCQRYFELHMLDLAGYRPQLFRCLGCDSWVEAVDNRFDIVAGGLYCPTCSEHSHPHGRAVSVGAQKVMRFLQRSQVEHCRRLVLSEALHAELESLQSAYMRHVLDRAPKSVRFIEAVRALPAEC